MSRNKKVIVIGALAATVLAASIGGVALARSDSYGPTGTIANREVSGNATQKTLLSRVAEILGIEQAQLEAAVKQAQAEQQLEALENRLQSLVEAGKITQEQADAYLQWYQSKPDLSGYQDALRQWQQSRPKDIPIPGGIGGLGKHNPRQFGRPGPGMMRGEFMRPPLPQGGPVQ